MYRPDQHGSRWWVGSADTGISIRGTSTYYLALIRLQQARSRWWSINWRVIGIHSEKLSTSFCCRCLSRLGGNFILWLWWSVFFEDGNVAHGTRDWLWIILIIELSWAHSHIEVQLLIKPDPDALLMELVLARSRDNWFYTLFQRLLADAAVSLICEF